MEKIKIDCQMKDKEFKQRFLNRLIGSGYFTMELEGKGDLLFTDFDDIPPGYEKIVLLDGEIRKHEFKDNLLRVYRFIKSQDLIQLIFWHFGYSKGIDEGEIWEGAAVVSCISTRGGIGCTSISRSLASSLFRNGYRPLYIDLCPFNLDREAKDNEDKNVGMLKFLYAAKRERIKDISAFVTRDGDVDTVKGSPVNMFSKDYDVEIISLLCKGAYSSGYDVLILDIGNHLTKENLDIVHASDITVEIIGTKDEWTDKKINKLDEALDLKERAVLHLLNDSIGEANNRIADREELADMEFIDVSIPYLGEMSNGESEISFDLETKFLADIVGGRLAEK